MPKGNIPYQYKSTDDPATLAAQKGITPQQLLSANQGGAPFSTGQMINIPQFNYGASVAQPAPNSSWANLLNGQQPTTPVAQPSQSFNYVNPTDPNFWQPRPRSNTPTVQPVVPNPVVPVVVQQQMQNLINQGVPPSVASTVAAATATLSGGTRGPTSRGNPGGFWDIVTRIQNNPSEYDSLPDVYKEAIDRRLQESGQGQTWEQRHAPGEDFAKTQGYQVNAGKEFGEQTTYINGKAMKIKDAVRKGYLDIKTGKRYSQPMKRNKKGKLVDVEGAAQAAPVQVENNQLAGFGVVNFSAGAG